MDHMNFLGTSLLKIANEKIGILKEKSLLILSKQKPSVRKLIRKVSYKKKSNTSRGRKEWKVLKKLKSFFILKFKNDIHEFKTQIYMVNIKLIMLQQLFQLR